MAISSKEVEIIGPGVVSSSPVNSSYVQNMYFKNKAWRVRKGFGQVGLWDTTLSRYTNNRLGNVEVEGFSKLLGSHYIKTSFGNEQIVSVLQLEAWTKNGLPKDTKLDLIAVEIWDITAGEHWEEILVQPTGSSLGPLPHQGGNYEDFPSWEVVTIDDKEQASFTILNDILFFSTPSIGVWYYKPAAFKGNRQKSINTTNARSGVVINHSGPYSDNTLVNPLVYTPNTTFSAEYEYLPFLAQPVQAITTWNGRLVILGRSTISASDQSKPASILAANVKNISANGPLVNVGEVNGNLLIFSESETFVYMPTGNPIVNGAVTQISNSIGCSNSSTLVNMGSALVWADNEGVYLGDGTINITPMAEDIKDLFNSSLSNPLNHYLTEQGEYSTTAPQPPMAYHFDNASANMTWHENLSLLFLNVPEQRVTACWSAENKQWSIWTWDSSAFEEGNVNKVGVRQNIECQQLVSGDTELYGIGLDNTTEIASDNARVYNAGTGTWVLDPNRNQTFRTFYITRHGRGGAIDRSSEYEDYRYGIGEWYNSGISAGLPYAGVLDASQNPDLFIDRPIKISEGYVLDGHTFVLGGALVPVYLKMPPTYGLWNEKQIYSYQINFTFDNLNWEPPWTSIDSGTITPRVNKVLNLVFPTPIEMAGSGMGYGDNLFAMNDGFKATLSAVGGIITVDWSSHVANNATVPSNQFWSQYDTIINAVPQWTSPYPQRPGAKQLLFMIPFEKVNSTSVSSMNIGNVNGFIFYDNYANVTPAAATDHYYKTDNHIFDFSAMNADRVINDVKAQGVDWCYLSPQIEPEANKQSKARGIYTKLRSAGTSTDPIANSWSTVGSNPMNFNARVSSDYRTWNAQVVDFTGNPPAISDSDIALAQSSIRKTIKNTNTEMGYKVFEDADNHWDGTSPNEVLADDQLYATMATSATSKGQWFTWLFFGHMLNKAETIVINTAKAAYRDIGSRRRKGH